MAKKRKKQKKTMSKKSAAPSFDAQQNTQHNTFSTGPTAKGGFTPGNKRSTQGARKR